MSRTTARTLQLLSLLQSRRVWSGPELISRLEVSERTLRRDIDRLRDLGYQVGSVSGPAGGYQLEAGADMPPLLLDDEEAMAIAMGLLTAAGGTIAGIEETSLRALAKLEQVLPPRIRRRVAMLEGAVVPLVRAWVTVDPETLTTLAQAVRDNERVRFDYRRRDGGEAERSVEPHQLVSIHQRWYLLGFDRDREDWRTFRLDRIASPRGTRLTFQPRKIPGGSALKYVEQSLRSMPMRYQVVVTVLAGAEEVERRFRPGESEVEAIDEKTSSLRIQGDSLEWLSFQLLWMEAPFVIHGPPELVAYLSDLSGRLADAVAPTK